MQHLPFYVLPFVFQWFWENNENDSCADEILYPVNVSLYMLSVLSYHQWCMDDLCNVRNYSGTCVLWIPWDQPKCPDYQGVLSIYIIMYHGYKCVDYVDIYISSVMITGSTVLHILFVHNKNSIIWVSIQCFACRYRILLKLHSYV